MLCPTRDKIHVLDAATARPRKVIDLSVRGAGGGNLLVADGRLLIATANELIALDLHGGNANENPDNGVAVHHGRDVLPQARYVTRTSAFGRRLRVDSRPDP